MCTTSSGLPAKRMDRFSGSERTRQAYVRLRNIRQRNCWTSVSEPSACGSNITPRLYFLTDNQSWVGNFLPWCVASLIKRQAGSLEAHSRQNATDRAIQSGVAQTTRCDGWTAYLGNMVATSASPSTPHTTPWGAVSGIPALQGGDVCLSESHIRSNHGPPWAGRPNACETCVSPCCGVGLYFTPFT